MVDQYGREIDYLRVSVTDRCNLRCVYCMPPEGVPPLRHADILTFEEILRVCRCAAGLGIRQIRLTGGEPLVRKGVAGLAAAIKAVDGIDRVTMTTNGTLLGEAAAALRQAGLDGVNVSLDTLSPEGFAQITRGGDLDAVLRGIGCALDAGLQVKLNCVPAAGPDAAAQIVRLAGLAREKPLDVRFIERMPVGEGGYGKGISGGQVFEILRAAYGELTLCREKRGSGPAEYWSAAGFTGKFGFISALSHRFCGNCNRVRLTAAGFLKLCLQYDYGIDLRGPLRSGVSDAELAGLLQQAIFHKPKEHRFGQCAGVHAERRKMSEIGG